MNDSVKKNQSLRKALDILEVMVDMTAPARLQDIAQKTDMSPSTVLRFLNTFIDFGYAKQDPETSLYYLTLKLADLGNRNRINYPFQGSLRKYIKDIATHFNESSSLCIEDDMQMVYIATEEGPQHMLQTLSRIGRIAPMHSTGVGKLFLTEYSDSKLDELVNRRGLSKLTEKTIVTLPELKAEIAKVKNQGYAIDEEECEIGVRCVAVPVREYSGKIVAAMSLSAPITRLTYDKTNEIINYLLDLSRQASEELGYKPVIEKNA